MVQPKLSVKLISRGIRITLNSTIESVIHPAFRILHVRSHELGVSVLPTSEKLKLNFTHLLSDPVAVMIFPPASSSNSAARLDICHGLNWY